MATDRPQPLAHVRDISPYVPGHAPPKREGRVFKLASNENPLGCSPLAREAMKACLDETEIYPDGDAVELRQSIASRYGLDAARIICGAGSDEILFLLGRAFLQPGDNIVQTQHAFLVYALSAAQSGAATISAKETVDMRADVDALLAAVNDKTRILFIANPNNPTGNYLPIDEVRRLHRGLPPNVLLVLDAAYAEYVSRNDYEAGIELVAENENVLMTRTFSKIHGLAALRIGWAYGSAHVIDALHRVRGPFNTSSLAQKAAIAALEDRQFVENCSQLNQKLLQELQDGVRSLGLRSIDSVTNFLLVQFDEVPNRNAGHVAAFLEKGGVSVRQMKSYGLPDWLRITVGDEEGVAMVLRLLKECLNP